MRSRDARFHDRAVGGKGLARTDQHPIAGPQAPYRHQFMASTSVQWKTRTKRSQTFTVGVVVIGMAAGV